MEKKTFTITNIEKDAENVKIFTLYPDDGQNILFKPGQFAVLYQIGNSTLSRPYSIASSPLNKELRFIIKIIGGQFTSLLDKMKTGEKLEVAGPFGHFVYEEQDKIICIAAGVGIAPMLGILEYIVQKKENKKIALFYSNKTQNTIACTHVLKKFQEQNKNIKIVYTLTRERPQDWKGELGRIDKHLLKKYVDYVSEAVIFVCGPVAFTKAMKETVLKLGANKNKIKIEGWG